MNNYQKDYLPYSKLKLYQDPKLFKINTATFLLSQFMKIYPGESVLDIGTNNGALILEASKYTKGRLVGVEIIEAATKVALENIKMHSLDNIEIVNSDIKHFQSALFDVIISNPPYFKDHINTTEISFKLLAKQEINLTLNSLLENINRLLKVQGRVYLIYPFIRKSELEASILKHNLFLKSIQQVFDFKSEKHRFLLVEITKAKFNTRYLPDLILNQDRGI